MSLSLLLYFYPPPLPSLQPTVWISVYMAVAWPPTPASVSLGGGAPTAQAVRLLSCACLSASVCLFLSVSFCVSLCVSLTHTSKHTQSLSLTRFY